MIAGMLGAMGRPVLQALAAVGRLALFAASVIGHILRPPFYLREFGQSLLQIGWFSLPVVGLTFIGGSTPTARGRRPRNVPDAGGPCQRCDRGD